MKLALWGLVAAATAAGLIYGVKAVRKLAASDDQTVTNAPDISSVNA